MLNADTLRQTALGRNALRLMNSRDDEGETQLPPLPDHLHQFEVDLPLSVDFRSTAGDGLPVSEMIRKEHAQRNNQFQSLRKAKSKRREKWMQEKTERMRAFEEKHRQWFEASQVRDEMPVPPEPEYTIPPLEESDPMLTLRKREGKVWDEPWITVRLSAKNVAGNRVFSAEFDLASCPLYSRGEHSPSGWADWSAVRDGVVADHSEPGELGTLQDSIVDVAQNMLEVMSLQLGVCAIAAMQEALEVPSQCRGWELVPNEGQRSWRYLASPVFPATFYATEIPPQSEGEPELSFRAGALWVEIDLCS